MTYMSGKSKVTLYINKDVVVKAKKLGLNLSVVSENSLIQAIEAMEVVYGKQQPKILPVSNLEKEDGGPDRVRTGDPCHVKAVSYH